MDYESALISKILAEKCMKEVVSLNLHDELFTHNLAGWEFLTKFYRDHGGSPPIEQYEKLFPEFELRNIDAPLSFFVEELRKRRVHNLLTGSMKEAAPFLKQKDPIGALDVFKKAVLHAETEARSALIVNLAENPKERLDEYHKIRDSGGLIGIPSMWKVLDEVTMGFQNEELWMVVARGGIGKSWFLIALARYHWGQGYVPLVVSKEMGVMQIAKRFDATNARLCHKRLRSGQLTHEEYKRFIESLEIIEGERPFWITGDSEGEGGISGIQAEIDVCAPHAVYIDGGYLVEDDRKATTRDQRLGNVMWDAKRLARRNKIPVFITHQFNLEGKGDKGDADTLAYGDVQKWFDGILGMYQTEDLRLNKEMLIKLLKYREGDRIQFVTGWDLENMSFEAKGVGQDDIDSQDSSVDDETEVVPF